VGHVMFLGLTWSPMTPSFPGGPSDPAGP